MEKEYIRTQYPGIAFVRSYWKCWKCMTPIMPWQDGDNRCSVEGCDGIITPGGIVPMDEVFREPILSNPSNWWRWKNVLGNTE